MIIISNLIKNYLVNKNEVQVLKGINLTFKNTGIYFLVGKSGSGKSTLLNIIGGNDFATSGNIYYNNSDITKFNESEINSYHSNDVGFVYQDFNLLYDKTVYDNIAISLQIQNIDKEEIPDKIQTISEQLQIETLLDRFPSEISGGERQRVAIARALVKNSKIILADEPTGSLDGDTAIELFDLLKHISKEKLVIVVTHDVELAQTYADNIYKMEELENNKAEEVSDSGTKLSTRKTRMPLLDLLKTAFSFVLIKPTRFIINFIIFIISFSFLTALLATFTTNTNSVVYEAIENGYMNKIVVQRNLEDGRYFNDSSISDFVSKTNISDYISSYDFKSYSRYVDYLTSVDSYYSYAGFNTLTILNQDVLNALDMELVSGRLPVAYNQTKKEVAISEYALEMFKIYGYKSFYGEEFEISDFDDLKDKDITVYGNDDKNYFFSIVGIIRTNSGIEKFDYLKNNSSESYHFSQFKRESLDFGLFVSNNFDIMNFSGGINNLVINSKNLNTNQIDALIDINTKREYHLLNYFMYSIDIYGAFLTDYKDLYLTGIIVLIVFAFLLILQHVLVIFAFLKKKIGIYRTLGISKSSIIYSFILSGIGFAILSTGFSLIGGSFILNYGNVLANSYAFIKLNLLHLNIVSVAITLLISVLISVFAFILPLLFKLKKYPIDLIEKRI
jgi:ABC-type lipoprotein export system ATPase subunit